MAKLNALPAARSSGLTFQLPTEQEWEICCRAGAPSSADYCKLADGTQITASTLSRVARYGKYLDDGPVDVGSFLPNAWGLYDMHGNVSEWCADWYGPYPSDAATDPKGLSSGLARVCRGGSWIGKARVCRSACRFGELSGYRFLDLGFRVALAPVQ